MSILKYFNRIPAIVVEHDQKLVAHGLSPSSLPQPVDHRDFLLLVCKSVFLIIDSKGARSATRPFTTCPFTIYVSIDWISPQTFILRIHIAI